MWALATKADVEVEMGRELGPSVDVDSLLATASDLVIGYLHPTPIPDPTPPPIVRVVAAMVAEVLDRRDDGIPAAATSQTSGPFSVGLDPTLRTRGPYLTAAMKMRLAPYAAGGGMTSIALTSGHHR